MKTCLLFMIIFLLEVANIYPQNMANFIGNGSFEKLKGNCNVVDLKEAIYWNSIDSIQLAAEIFSYCNGRIPNQFNSVYQLPRSGSKFAGATFHYRNSISERHYIKNRLKDKLSFGITYCAKFHVNIMNRSSIGNDGFGIYFSNNLIDTISKIFIPLTYITPQIKCPDGYPIADTLGWVTVSGTFVAQGDEKYALIGIFEPNNTLDTVLINPITLPLIFTDACIDDVSCIPIDLPAYAGPNKSCVIGDSVFIGREPDVEIDESCIWYKLNANGTVSNPIDTVAGLYVKPVTTTTYIVRQQLWCSGVKYDTVVVYRDFVGLPNVSSSGVENSIKFKMLSNYLLIENTNTQNYSLNIFDAQGKEVFSQSNLNQNFKLNFVEQQSGVYIIQIQNQQGVLRKKVVFVKED